jgi:peptidoglycan-associated lipoprotein
MAVCILWAGAPPALAGGEATTGSEATLELFVSQPDELALEALHLVVDGGERAVTLPSAAEASAPVYSGAVAPGAHDLAVEAIYRGRSPIFTYLEGYRFHIRGRGKLEVAAGEVVRVQSRVLSREGLTVQWHEKPYLSLTAVTSHSVRRIDAAPTPESTAEPPEPKAEAAPPGAAPAKEPQPTVAAAPAPEPQPTAAAAPAPEQQRAAVAQAPEPQPSAAATQAPEPEPRVAAAGPRRRMAAESRSRVVAAPAPGRPAPVAATTGPTPCAFEPVHFEFDKADLSEDARAALDRFAACLAGAKGAVLLEGHCDVRGSEEYNQWLGGERGRSAARQLRERGVASGRITVRSYGKSRPLCTEDSPECHARNRRVEAVLKQ